MVRKIYQKAVLLALALMLAGCSQMSPATAPTTPASAPSSAQGRDFADVVSAKGIVAPIQEAALSFPVAGQLEAVSVTEGQAVNAGDVLAKITARNLPEAVTEAEAGLKSSQAGLAKAKAGARPEELTSAKAAAAAASASAAAVEGAVKIAEGNLAATRADLSATESAVKVAEGAAAAGKATLAAAQAALDKLQAGATAREIQIAEQEVEQAKNQLFSLQKQRDASFGAVEGQIGAAEAAVKIASLQLEGLKSPPRPEDLAAARAQVSQGQASVLTATGQLGQARARVEQARALVQVAEAQVEQAKAQLDNAAAQAKQAQAQLDLVAAGTRPEDIAVAEAAVARSEAALAAAQRALDDAVLTAPFAATVGAVLANSGETIAPQAPVIRLGDLTRLTVKTEDLAEGDVALVKLGQKATVTIDALPGEKLSGTVARIAPLATDRRGDKVYEVVVALEPGMESALRWGMTAFVEIDVRQ